MALPSASSALYQPLDGILGSPARVRVARVLAGYGGNLAVADIARRSRLALPSTRAALRRLLESEAVTAVGAGRTMICALNRDHPLGEALIALFAAERAQADFVLDTVRTAAAELQPEPIAVWLYGSVARSEDEPRSDIDIALLSALDNPTPQAEALREAIAVAIPARHQRVSVVAFAPRDVRQMVEGGAPFWQFLQRDAVVLAGDAPAGVVERVSSHQGERR